VAAEAGDVQVGLLDIRRHARGRTTALHVNDHERHFRHDRPAERFGLQRDPRTAGAGDRHAAGVAAADGHRDRRDFVLALHERAAVFRQLAPQQFHDVGPRRNRITRAEPDSGGDQTVGDGLVAIHHDLLAVPALAINKLNVSSTPPSE
jgi:hypothetical protein